MRLTNYSDYALRSLIYLAVRPEPPLLANISDIADSYGNLGVLIKKIEPDFDLVECFATPANDKSSDGRQTGLPITLIDETTNNARGCVISPACQLKSVFFEALTAFINVLERYTLADIINNEDELASLLFR